MVSKDQPKHDSTAPCLNARARAKTEWEALKPDEIDLFNRNVVCRKYKAAQAIFHQGDPCKGLYFVESGLVAVRKVDEVGKSAIVRLAHQGDTLGYRPLLAKQCHRATAEVINESRICFLDATTMRQFLLSNPKLGMRFHEGVCSEANHLFAARTKFALEPRPMTERNRIYCHLPLDDEHAALLLIQVNANQPALS